MKKLKELKELNEAPTWMTEESYATLCDSYLFKDETPRGMYERIARTAVKYLKNDSLYEQFFNALWKNWLCPSTPVLTNSGTDRGLPISCFSSYMEDTTISIMDTLKEIALLSKYGGGTAIHMNDVRCKGSPISRGGMSDGVVPFMKMADSVIVGISQGSVRRGACAVYLDIEHGDFNEFLASRKPSGDVNRQCLNIQHGVTVKRSFIEKVEKGDVEARNKWKALLKSRLETGGPYIFFSDVVNENKPEAFKDYEIRGSNLCNEICLPTNKEMSLVCCLSSLNLAKYDEWKDTNTVELGIFLLDAVMSEFIEKAETMIGFERAVKFAKHFRALGLGVLGWHSFLQQKGIAFESLQSYLHNRIVFQDIRSKAEVATAKLAELYGEPDGCKGLGRRNATLMAIAPTLSNALIASNVSQGIEPWIANAFAQKSAKGTFVRKNPQLESFLETLGQNTDETWASILQNDGSVQQLNFLTPEQKEVYLTAKEINQFTIVKLAAARQEFIDQGQSLNLFFPANSDPKYINGVHTEAAKAGIKGLYYLRSTSVIKTDQNVNAKYKRELSECKFCEG